MQQKAAGQGSISKLQMRPALTVDDDHAVAVICAIRPNLQVIFGM
jgi:hypothetical protein